MDSAVAPPPPRLSSARCEWTRSVEIVDADGVRRTIQIPEERPLTLYVDRQELVTLMTLGQQPELLVLGYLHTQGLIEDAASVESITVDWEVAAAAVSLRSPLTSVQSRLARRVVTTGCGQGSVLAEVMESLPARLPPQALASRVAQSTLVELFDQLRRSPSVHRDAGSVHGSALAVGGRILVFVEDVGRHNAVDTIAGWMLLHRTAGHDKLLVTTGRLTSEMVLKAARLEIPIVASRNGVTAMGHELAQRLQMTLIGRASGRRFLCYCGAERLVREG